MAGKNCSYIDIRFWSELDVPNEITFRFPFTEIRREDDFDDSKRFVFLHPSLAVPVTEGLYFEPDVLKQDCRLYSTLLQRMPRKSVALVIVSPCHRGTWRSLRSRCDELKKRSTG